MPNLVFRLQGKDDGFSNQYNDAQKKIKKLGQSYVNISKDGNRASQSISGFGKALPILKFSAFQAIAYSAMKSLTGFTQASMESIEVQNLFTVSLGEQAQKAEQTVKSLSNLYGLDSTNLKSSIGTFALLAKSMGMNGVQADVLSESTTQLALDLSSLMNVPISQVMGDLRSGLIGQTETVYKYGMDLTEASLKQEAVAQGITKSVRNMSQGEKMALRYSLMLKQSTLAHGDFAKTLNQPANQSKILSERITTLTRAIGNMFMPMLSAVLPWLNAFVIVLTQAANAIARLLGYQEPAGTGVSSNLDNVGNSANEVSDSIGGATSAAKELRKTLLGIDELNLMDKPTTTSAGGGGGVGDVGDSILDGIDLESYDILFGGITDKASEYAQIIKDKLAPAFEDFAKSLSNVAEFGRTFKYYVIDPIAGWVVNTGLPGFVGILSQFNREVVPELKKYLPDLNRLWTDFIEPMATLIITEGLPKFVTLLSDFITGMRPVVGIVVDALIALWDDFLEPSMKFAFNEGFTSLGDFFKNIGKTIEDNPNLKDTLVKIVEALIILKGLNITIKGASSFLTFIQGLSAIKKLGTVIQLFKILGSNIKFPKIPKITIPSGLSGLLPTLSTILATVTAVVTGFVGIGGLIAGWDMTKVENWGKGFSDVAEWIKTEWNLMVDVVTGKELSDHLDDLPDLFEDAFSNITGGHELSDFLALEFEIASTVWGGLSDVFQWEKDAIQDILDAWSQPMRSFWGGVYTGMTEELDGMDQWWSDTVDEIKGHVTPLKTFFSETFRGIKTIIKPIIDGIVDLFIPFASQIKMKILPVDNKVGEVFRSVKETIQGYLDGINEAAKWWGENIGSVVGQAIKNEINAAFSLVEANLNAAILILNTLVAPLNKMLPAGQKISPLKKIDIPALATGGIVTSSTFANIGEAGDEAVIPLESSKLQKYFAPILGNNKAGYDETYKAVYDAMTKATGSDEYVVNVYVDGVYDSTIKQARRKNVRSGKIVAPIGGI